MASATTSHRPKGFFFPGQYGAIDTLFLPADLERLHTLVDLYAPPQTPAAFSDKPELWAQAEIIIPTWGCTALTPAILAAMPQLKAIFHVGGTSKFLVTPEVVARRIPVSSTYAANGIPVAEFAFAQILLGLKSVWQHIALAQRTRTFERLPRAGAFRSTVGIVSLGMIGREVVDLLRHTDVRVIAYDPYVTPEEAAALGVELVSLDDVFRRADVVSVHTPWLKSTEGMITGAHIAGMKAYSTFINTGRGAVVNEAEMIEVLQRRPDLVAALDVTHPEPPAADSPLWTLPNVVLTPHIAGALGAEAFRLGQYALDEIERFVTGQPLRWVIKPEQAAILA